MQHPIEHIQWIPAEDLDPNDWNPNICFDQELKLLKFSLLKQGWIQPVLASNEDGRIVIIDGFHRWWLTMNDPDVKAMSNGRVPCAILEMEESERKMLTVRINRAKGSHMAFKMHDLVKSLVVDNGLSVPAICEGIGANRDEVELLLQEGVFQKLDIPNHKYSQAWVPKPKSERRPGSK